MACKVQHMNQCSVTLQHYIKSKAGSSKQGKYIGNGKGYGGLCELEQIKVYLINHATQLTTN